VSLKDLKMIEVSKSEKGVLYDLPIVKAVRQALIAHAKYSAIFRPIGQLQHH